ncbi:MAG: hypothetical protein NUV58_02440 [Candidatus Roizmanbacteria bacterium]|nr:hypothetical protein [Candidatus Roizmanbacteria bacterium]
MGINSKIAKIPFFILYLIIAVFTSYNWISVILFQKDFEIFRTQQPWDYYLSSFFAKTFEITQQQYFIFAFPVMLLGLYLIPKIIGKLMDLDKKSNVKGDNHVVIILILLIAPTTLGLYKLFNFGWKSHLIPSFILIVLFSILSWIDERNKK